MNQPNLSTMAPKTTAAAPESPELMAMLKRYAWLLIAGAVVGAGVAGGWFAYAARYQAEYTASIPFQVLPPQAPIGQSESPSLILNPEDTSTVIHRQEYLFKQDTFLSDVLKSEEFRKRQDGLPGDTDWLRQHNYDSLFGLYHMDPMKGIKKSLIVMPQLNAGTFEITMTTRNPAEAQSLLIAAVKVYTEKLQSDSRVRHTAFARRLEDAVKTAQDNFQIKSDALVDFGRRKGIDVLKSRFDIEKNALQGLNDDWTRADAAASGAEQQYEAIKKTKAEGKEIPLSSDLQQGVENDYTLKTLMNTRLSWEQEKAAELKKNGGSPITVAAIDARLAKIDEQIADTRKKLESDARDRMEKMLQDEAIQKRFLADYINDLRKKKEEIVTGIGQDLLVWQQRVDDLKELGDLVSKMRIQLGLAQANQATDDTRVSRMIEADPAIPTVTSWPKWYMFLPLGTLAGLGVSALLAYLFVLTDTRIRTPRDISRMLQLPVLGFVPDEGDDRMLTGDVETAILTSPASMVAESFRQIRGHITAQTAHNPINTVIVASIGPGGGATTVASNLAAAMALNDLRVLLVDANFYRPSLNQVYKDLPKEGLTDAVADPSTADGCILQHPSLARLHVMGVGTATTGASSELFESKSFREVMEHLKGKYDMVIFDGAPLNLVSDSLALAARVDGVIPVVRAGEVSRGAVSRLRDQIRSVHGNLLGFVLNAAQTSNTGYYKENYRTFYKYAQKKA